MSRIGKKPIPIPKGVTVKVAADAVEVQGPKGKLRQMLPPGIVFAQEDGTLVAKLQREDNELRKFHGLARSLVANAVAGVVEGITPSPGRVGDALRMTMKARPIAAAASTTTPAPIRGSCQPRGFFCGGGGSSLRQVASEAFSLLAGRSTRGRLAETALRIRVSMSEIGSVISLSSLHYQELFVTPVTSPSSAAFRKHRRHMANFRM